MNKTAFRHLFIVLTLLIATVSQNGIATATPIRYQACSGYQSSLPPGTLGQVIGAGSRFRDGAGTDKTQIGTIPSGDLFLVTGGPQCANDLTWVEALYGGQFGWVAEGNESQRFLDVAGKAPTKPREDQTEIQALSNGFGGGDLITSACTTVPLNGGILGFYKDDQNSDSLQLANGQTATFTQEMLQGQSLLGYPVELCSEQPITQAFATFNSRRIPVKATQENGIFVVRLPEVAFVQPGRWALTANNYTINIVIPTPTRPFYNFLTADSDKRLYTLVLGGFKPNERIAVIAVSDDSGNGGNGKIDPGEYEAQEVQANGQGFFIGKLSIPKGLSAMMMFVGNLGTVTMRGNSTDGTPAQFLAQVRQIYWSTTSSGGGNPPPNSSGPLVIFYQNTGSGSIGVVANGKLSQTNTPGLSGAWTAIGGIQGRILIFYDGNTGTATIARASNNGQLQTLQAYSWTTGWTHIIGTKDRFVLFYRATTGDAFVSQFKDDGTYVDLNNYAGQFSKGWTQITALGDGRLAFYNALTGDAASGEIDSSGAFRTVKNQKLSAGWTQVAAGGGDLLLYYNRANGIAVSERLNADGSFSDLKRFNFASWSHVVGSNGALLFYNKDTGKTVVGALATDGSFTQTPAFDSTPGWQFITSTR